ncbi:MAG TPA: DUF3459 domain-containing protein, partial [Jiangellaceae bacterium]|nr:DUF3459 domain-containing protein [Jiangellaceae bacterium]
GARSVQAQQYDSGSMLNLYKEALRLRRDMRALGLGSMEWLPGHGEEVLAFRREPDFACVVNLGAAPVKLLEHNRVRLSSAPLDDGLLPPDAAVWLAV